MYRLTRSEKNNRKTDVILEKIDIDEDNFPTVTEYKNGVAQENKKAYRYVQSDGMEVKIIDLKTKDGHSYTKRIASTPDKSYISNKVQLKDKRGNDILNFTSRLEQKEDGNNVTIVNGNQLHEYTSKIEDKEITLTHNERTYVIPLKNIIHICKKGETLPVQYAYCSLTGDEPIVISRDKNILDLAKKTEDNFRNFLKRINADDLLTIAQNGQRIDLSQFGYDEDGQSLEDTNYALIDKSYFLFCINEDSSLINTHEITHGINAVTNITENLDVREMYEKELKNISAESKYHLDYFLPCSSASEGGLSELVAETGAIKGGMDIGYPSLRMLKLMQEFPETTAMIIKLLFEYKENL
jgi:hypothetical protein